MKLAFTVRRRVTQDNAAVGFPMRKCKYTLCCSCFIDLVKSISPGDLLAAGSDDRLHPHHIRHHLLSDAPQFHLTRRTGRGYDRPSKGLFEIVTMVSRAVLLILTLINVRGSKIPARPSSSPPISSLARCCSSSSSERCGHSPLVAIQHLSWSLHIFPSACKASRVDAPP
jgi:hypothetical protein